MGEEGYVFLAEQSTSRSFCSWKSRYLSIHRHVGKLYVSFSAWSVLSAVSSNYSCYHCPHLVIYIYVLSSYPCYFVIKMINNILVKFRVLYIQSIILGYNDARVVFWLSCSFLFLMKVKHSFLGIWLQEHCRCVMSFFWEKIQGKTEIQRFPHAQCFVHLY